jgi:hypothetical protein
MSVGVSEIACQCGMHFNSDLFSCQCKSEHEFFLKKINDSFKCVKSRNIKNEKEVGSRLFVVRKELEFLHFPNDVLLNLKGVEICLSGADQLEWEILNWALKPLMFT